MARSLPVAGVSRRSRPSNEPEHPVGMSLHDMHRGQSFHVWTRRDELLGWSWCYSIGREAPTCTHDESFSTEAMALIVGEAAARDAIERSEPRPPTWQRWMRQRFMP
jgi:hypothetical protein